MSIKFADRSISYDAGADLPSPTPFATHTMSADVNHVPRSVRVTEKRKKAEEGVEADALAREESNLRDDELAQMLVNDPVGFEEAIMRNDLVDSRQTI